MQIAVITNDALKKELTVSAMPETGVSWLNDLSDLSGYDVIVDLEYENLQERKSILCASNAKLVIINSVEHELAECDPSFVRINAWPTFLKGNIVEASSLNENNRMIAEHALAYFNKKIEWLPDISGFVTPRVISMIINEAYIALGENVSTKNDIDIAMKTGTNYPYGPFEWSQLIGLNKIASLLKKMAGKENRYQPSPLLLQES
jgi:3-hydroxybutyryl-CoA dehydrogenase